MHVWHGVRLGIVSALWLLSEVVTPLAGPTVAQAAVPIPTFTELHAFRSVDGFGTHAPLVQGSDGNFYGTAPEGGDDGNGCAHGCAGTVFKLTPAGQFTVLHTFAHDNPTGAYANGNGPSGALAEGPDGFLYGTTAAGGFNNQGIVYKLSKDGQVFQKLHDFCQPGACQSDGMVPATGLIVGRDGNLYGRTDGSGSLIGPTIFRITPDGSLTTLYNPGRSDVSGFHPGGPLLQASDGNFYFVNPDAIYTMTPQGLVRKLYTFGTNQRTDGEGSGGLIRALDGNLYGVTKPTFGAGVQISPGVIYRVSLGGVFQQVFLFGGTTGSDADTLAQTADGNLWTTAHGGNGLSNNLVTVGTDGTLQRVTAIPQHEIGIDVFAPLLVARDGKLYGTAGRDGRQPDGTLTNGGAVFMVDPNPAAGPIVLLPAPQRPFDSRVSGGAVLPGHDRCVLLAGLFGIPLDATGVVVNLTAVGQTSIGWLTLYPHGPSVPPTSTLNFDPNEWSIANGATVRLGPDGQVCVNAGNSAAQAILDVTGYLTADAPNSLPLLANPARAVDTRVGAAAGPIVPGTDRCFTLAGAFGIPADASGVVLNVTATGFASSGWLTVYPGGQPLPPTSTLNFDNREYAFANNAMIKLGGGQVCVDAGHTPAHAILDVAGYVTSSGASQLPLITPVRLVDTRISLGGPGGQLRPGPDRCFSLTGLSGVPGTASGVIVNATAVGQAANGWFTLYPAGQALPPTSTLNFDPDEVAIANGAVLRVSANQVCVDAGQAAADVIVDVTGFIPGP